MRNLEQANSEAESTIAVTRERKMGNYYLMGMKFQFGKGEKILQM